MSKISWVVFLVSCVLPVVSTITGWINQVWYVSRLSEIALMFAGFVAVRANATAKEVRTELVAKTQIEDNKEEPPS